LRNPPSEPIRDAAKLLDRLRETFDVASDDDDHVRPSGEELRMQAEGFSNETLGPVPLRGASVLAGHRDPEPGGLVIGAGQDEQHVARRGDSAPAGLDSEKVRPFADAPLGGEPRAALFSTVRFPSHGVGYFL